ncbi:hypothetical protein DRL91_23190 [Salmonella enterica subsp. enterica serovar Infantis]|nr:hypothetical protein [Salmonella enterica subsp. enterica serovar Infantis]
MILNPEKVRWNYTRRLISMSICYRDDSITWLIMYRLGGGVTDSNYLSFPEVNNTIYRIGSLIFMTNNYFSAFIIHNNIKYFLFRKNIEITVSLIKNKYFRFFSIKLVL